MTEPTHNDYKPRDEIAQHQVDFREKMLGIDLDDLPLKKIGDLAQGDVVLHEGLWCKIDQWIQQEIGIHLVLKLEHGDSNWNRQVICMPHELFYVKPDEQKIRARGVGNVRRVPRTEETQ